MRLKKLQLQGFKTFANKTEFLFDEGITAVVGPNGSGKSNVADAIKWVLGEQSNAELRCKKVIDLVFAGSQSRPRASMASATLTLDNSSGWLPIDYSEVELSRRTYRSGENDYFINNNKVRLRDVRDLLATSGLGQRTYTLIGQGLIDRALSLKSEERRALFEEAAGIAHYKIQRELTLKHLHEKQRNLERVNDLLLEIAPRLKTLKRQAGITRNYEQLQRDLTELLRVWYGYHWQSAQSLLDQCQQRGQQAEKIWQENRQQLIALQEKYETLRRQLNETVQALQLKEENQRKVRQQWEQIRRQIGVLQERQTLLARQIDEIVQELPDLEEQTTRAKADLGEATEERQKVQLELQQELQKSADFEARYQAQQIEIGRIQKQITQLETEIQTHQKTLSQAEGQLSQLREQSSGQNRDEVEELSQILDQIKQLSATISTLQAQQQTIRQQRQTILQQRQTAINGAKQLRQEQQTIQNQLTSFQKTLAGLEARADLLNQLRQKATKFKGNSRILHRLATMITIPAPYQLAIEVALSATLNALVVADEGSLWELLQNNPTQSLVSVVNSAELPHTVPPFPEENSVIGWACHHVEHGIDPIPFLFLRSILLVKDRQTAYKIALHQLPTGTMSVSLDGIVVHAGGIVVQRIVGQETVLEQERQWREAQELVTQQQAEIVVWREKSAESQRFILEQQKSVDHLAEQESTITREEQRLAQQIGKTQQKQEGLREQATFLQRQQENRAKEAERRTQRIAELEAQIEENRRQLLQKSADLVTIRTQLQTLPIGEAQQQRTNQQQRIASLKTIVDGRRAVVDSRHTTLGQISTRLQRQIQRRDALLHEQNSINLAQDEQTSAELSSQLHNIEKAIEPLRSKRLQLQTESAELETEISRYQKQAHVFETAYTESRLALSQQKNQIEHWRERIHSDLGLVDLSNDFTADEQPLLPIEKVVEKLPFVIELPNALDESIQKRRGQLQRLGAINPDAPTEYDALQQRFDHLTTQTEDLNRTEALLRQELIRLDQLTSEQFATTVQQVNGVFGEMFTRLFGGGTAELQLTEPDNLTLTGVDIVAQLPRRRPQGLNLLSGGERSLTAAALIFALLKVNPPPFCVMDEVDAALDEANVNRFREALIDLSSNTQFVIITHNRGTVQAASTLYGISMGRDSASQLLSIKPEDYLEKSE